MFNRGKHVFLGSTPEVFRKIKERIDLDGGSIESLDYLELPFGPFEEFDYENIANAINVIGPNYIWVSLGAPKQEYFMSKLIPFLNKGVMLGVGAAFNYFSGEIKDIPEWTKKLYMVWLYRLVTEPKKQINRLKPIFLNLPAIIFEEKKKVKMGSADFSGD